LTKSSDARMAAATSSNDVDRSVRQAAQTLRAVRTGAGAFSAGADGMHRYTRPAPAPGPGSRHAGGNPEEASSDLEQGGLLQPQLSQPHVPRQQSLQQMRNNDATTDEVLNQVIQDLIHLAQRHKHLICFVTVVFGALSLIMLVLWCRAAFAALIFYGKPCDQPLKFYLLVAIIWSQITRVTQLKVAEWSFKARTILTCVLIFLGWCVIGWGVYMISAAKTCQETNAALFFPTQQYIYGQAIFTPVFLAIVVVSAMSLRPFVLRIARLLERPGCEEAVHELPKVAIGSPELIAEDGEVIACSICMAALTGDSDPPVRTPCNHYYHEDCLAQWCTNHTTCPLCRKEIAPPESALEPEE